MTEISSAAFLDLVAARSGHFSMESGLHSALWLELDALFARPAQVEPFIATLARQLAPLRPDAVCGPLLGGAFLAQRIAQILDVEFWFTQRAADLQTGGLYRAQYQLPAAFTAGRAHPRLALVDDVMSAGSSLRATHAAAHSRANVVAVGALLQLGRLGADYFAGLNVPVVAALHQSFEVWPPADCPQCAAGVPLESVAPSA